MEWTLQTATYDPNAIRVHPRLELEMRALARELALRQFGPFFKPSSVDLTMAARRIFAGLLQRHAAVQLGECEETHGRFLKHLADGIVAAPHGFVKDGLRRIKFFASREEPDDRGDLVELNGLSTTEYLRDGPYLTVDHNKNLKIGKVTELRRERVNGVNALTGTAVLLSPGRSALVDQVWSEIESGQKTGISIGGKDASWEPRARGRGKLFTRSVLDDISVVRVPACPGCRVQR